MTAEKTRPSASRWPRAPRRRRAGAAGAAGRGTAATPARAQRRRRSRCALQPDFGPHCWERSPARPRPVLRRGCRRRPGTRSLATRRLLSPPDRASAEFVKPLPSACISRQRWPSAVNGDVPQLERGRSRVRSRPSRDAATRPWIYRPSLARRHADFMAQASDAGARRRSSRTTTPGDLSRGKLLR